MLGGGQGGSLDGVVSLSGVVPTAEARPAPSRSRSLKASCACWQSTPGEFAEAPGIASWATARVVPPTGGRRTLVRRSSFRLPCGSCSRPKIRIPLRDAQSRHPSFPHARHRAGPPRASRSPTRAARGRGTLSATRRAGGGGATGFAASDNWLNDARQSSERQPPCGLALHSQWLNQFTLRRAMNVRWNFRC